MALTPAQKKAAAAKAAKAAATKKEAAYIKSLSNPITSQYDPRIAVNAGLNPEMADTQMTSSGQAPKDVTPVDTGFEKACINT